MKEYSLKYYRQIGGKDAWLAGMSGIGPRTTVDPKEALRFTSEQEAMQHPAFSHPICLLDVCEAPML